MKICSLVAAANIGVMFLLVLGIKAEAAELTVLSAIGMQSVMEDLGPKFERATGHRLAISFATAGVTVKRVQDGETNPRYNFRGLSILDEGGWWQHRREITRRETAVTM
jgi:ABC-type molybdate transport system substrate-binding protein